MNAGQNGLECEEENGGWLVASGQERRIWCHGRRDRTGADRSGLLKGTGKALKVIRNKRRFLRNMMIEENLDVFFAAVPEI